MKHEVRPNSSLTSASLLLGVSVEAIQKFHTEMKAWDLGQKIKSKTEKSQENLGKTDKNR